MKTNIRRLAFTAAFMFAFCCAGAQFAAAQEPLDGPKRDGNSIKFVFETLPTLSHKRHKKHKRHKR